MFRILPRPPLAVAAAALLLACSGDESGSVDQGVLAAQASRADPDLGASAAPCFVATAVEQLGVIEAEELIERNAAQERVSIGDRSTWVRIRQSCERSGEVEGEPEGSTTSGPSVTFPPDGEIDPDAFTYGDDPTLDALWDQCEAGSGKACDELYLQAPLDSEYEQFAYTCGNRPAVIICTDLDRPGPPPTRVPASVPPPTPSPTPPPTTAPATFPLPTTLPE